MQAKVEISTYQLNGDQKELTRRLLLENKQCGEWAFIRLTETGPRQKDVPWGNAWAANSKYWAYAEQRKEGGAWLLVSLEEKLVGGKPPKGPQVVADALTNVSHLIRFDNAESLADLSGDKSFSVSEAAALGDNKKLVQIRFNLKRDPEDTRPSIRQAPSIEGSAILDTDHYWVVKRAELKLQFLGGYAGEVLLQNEYRSGPDNVPIPVQARRQTTFFLDPDRQKSRQEEQEYRFEFVEQESVPEIEFSLTALDLPEPVGVAFARPTRWYLRFILAGVASLGVGLALFKLAKRGRRHPPAQNVKPA
jgi:hypothetical protein